jgi:hypothetical protein
MRATQRQREINRRRSEENSRELPSGNENGRLRGCHLLANLERDLVRTSNRQWTCFELGPGDYFVHQTTQWSIIPIVVALHMKRTTDGDWSFTSPDGKIERIVD